MEVLIYIYFLLPVLVAFVVLWYLDSVLIRKLDNSFIIALIEVCVAILIVGIGERTVFYLLFSQ